MIRGNRRKRKKVKGRRKPRKKDECRKGFFLLVSLLVVLALVAAGVRLFFLKPVAGHVEENIRPMHVAGQFYPAQQGNLEIMVDSFLGGAEDEHLGDIKALVAPHAGYVYSGQTAAYAFKQLESQKGRIKKVFIIGCNHARGAWFKGVSIANYTHYETPLGKVRVSPIAAEMREREPFTLNDMSHTSHIIEVELPFLQRVLGDGFEIIPMVVGSADQDVVNDAAKVIDEYFDSSSLLVVSSDLSHYHPYGEAVKLDTECIGQIEAGNFSGVARCEACGREAILILLRLSQMNGWMAKILDYRNSGDTAGDKSGVVGYSAIAFYTDPVQFEVEVVNKEEQRFLLGLARETVESYVRDRKVPEVDAAGLTDSLREVRGCFVTLNKDGRLRGCIGHILPQRPLWECVIENAVNAATADSRFLPVTPDELDDISIEVSVLTLPKELEYGSPSDLLSMLREGVDGVVLRSGFRTSTFLPQVWEMFGSKQSFLEALCRKQGSPGECWKNARVSVYQAQVFWEGE